jgi:capsular polysaccharide transport system ATP-binding protein
VIFLEHLSKTYRVRNTVRHVLRDVTAALSTTDGNLAILAHASAGKSTLIELLAGSLQPTSGRVLRTVRVSWPLGWRGFSGNFTGAESVGFLARIYGASYHGMLSYVAEVSGLAVKMYESMDRFKPEEKSRLMLAAAYGLDFDVYLLDGQMPKVAADLQPRYHALWLEKIQQQRVIAAATHTKDLESTFPRAAILHDGKLTMPMPFSTAATMFFQITRT